MVMDDKEQEEGLAQGDVQSPKKCWLMPKQSNGEDRVSFMLRALIRQFCVLDSFAISKQLLEYQMFLKVSLYEQTAVLFQILQL